MEQFLAVALANGLIIAAAFSGMALITNDAVLHVIQATGGIFLVHIGIVFLRSRTALDPAEVHRAARTTWTCNLGLGLASGLLNPKNALFYVSLASAVTTASPAALVLYGGWMFTLVLVWDLFVAMALGFRRADRRQRDEG